MSSNLHVYIFFFETIKQLELHQAELSNLTSLFRILTTEPLTSLDVNNKRDIILGANDNYLVQNNNECTQDLSLN